MIDFSKVDMYRKETTNYIKSIEEEINTSDQWNDFFNSLNSILKDKYKIDSKPTLHCAISGTKFHHIRFWSFSFIGKNMPYIFKFELDDNGRIITDLFSSNMVLFKNDGIASEYSKSLQNLNSYLSSFTAGFNEKESDLYHEYNQLGLLFREEKDKVNTQIENKFKDEKFQKSIMDKINKYFTLDSSLKIEFETSLYYDHSKMKTLKDFQEIYKLNFYIAHYGLCNVLTLATVSFDIYDIKNTIKVKAKLIDNVNVLNSDISGVNYLQTTLKRKLKKLVLDEL